MTQSPNFEVQTLKFTGKALRFPSDQCFHSRVFQPLFIFHTIPGNLVMFLKPQNLKWGKGSRPFCHHVFSQDLQDHVIRGQERTVELSHSPVHSDEIGNKTEYDSKRRPWRRAGWAAWTLTQGGTHLHAVSRPSASYHIKLKPSPLWTVGHVFIGKMLFLFVCYCISRLVQ